MITRLVATGIPISNSPFQAPVEIIHVPYIFTTSKSFIDFQEEQCVNTSSSIVVAVAAMAMV